MHESKGSEGAGRTVEGFAAAAGVHEETVRRWMRLGRLATWTGPAGVVILNDPSRFISSASGWSPQEDEDLDAEPITVIQYARECRVSTTTVHRWVASGRVRSIRDGRRVFVFPEPEPEPEPEPVPEPGPDDPAPGLTVKQYAQACGVSPTTVGRWVKEGRVEHHRVGNRTMVLTEPSCPPPGMTSEQFARETGVTRATVLRWAQEGKLEHHRSGKRVYITTDPAPFRICDVPEGALHAAEFAAATGLSYTTVWRRIQAGRLPSMRSGHKTYVLADPEQYRACP